jgi:tRNA-Thr(GGU) m(6)t(6)A37 methyltransferase TsaA
LAAAGLAARRRPRVEGVFVTYELRPVGHVESVLHDRASAPRQGDEGAPAAWLVFDAHVAVALQDLSVGTEVIVLTWLHQADRDVRSVRPRGDPARPMTGVFATRAPDRPNPIGLHRVRIEAVEGLRLRVSPLEAIDGTPIVDVKPVLDRETER